jgi:hypothetical protein
MKCKKCNGHGKLDNSPDDYNYSYSCLSQSDYNNMYLITCPKCKGSGKELSWGIIYKPIKIKKSKSIACFGEHWENRCSSYNY